MRRQPTRGFSDSGKTAQPGAQRGAPAFGSPAAGITRLSSFDWLDSLSDIAENAGDVVNAVKGDSDPKPAASVQKPKATALGGLNPTILYLGLGIALLIVALTLFRK
jgi:hypothetical protein